MDYWREAVECALDEAEIEATPEQITTIALSIKTSADNRSLLYPTPENPLRDEMRRMEQRHAEELRDTEKERDVYRRTLAARVNVEPRRVHIHNGEVEISRT